MTLAEGLTLTTICGLIALGEILACRTAWRWGAEVPERFASMERFFTISGPVAGCTGSLAVFFGFLTATRSSLDETGAGATWQLVVMSPVLAVLVVSAILFFAVYWWSYPPFAIPPALRGSVVIAPEDEGQAAQRVRLLGQPTRVHPGDVQDVPEERRARALASRDPAALYRRGTSPYSRALFLGGLLPTAAGALLGLGPRGAAGILPIGLVFVPFTGAGVVFATYGVLLARRRLPSVLAPAVPPRGGGIGLAAIGASLTALGLAVQIVSVASAVATVGGSALFCIAAARLVGVGTPQLRRGESPHYVAFVGLVLCALLWGTFTPGLLR